MSRQIVSIGAIVLTLLLGACESGSDGGREDGFNAPGSSEPFSGTVFPEPRLIGRDSRSEFVDVVATGTAPRNVLDLRTGELVAIDARLFTASFLDGRTIEVVVHPEVGDDAVSRAEAERYARMVGQLPRVLRGELERLWINPGRALWRSLDGTLVVHVGEFEVYDDAGVVPGAGIAEETLMHEAVHVSIDPRYATSLGWLAAQRSDDGFVSSYARDFPQREDLAESFVMWLAVRQQPAVMPSEVRALVEAAIPARLAWFDAQGFDLAPAATPPLPD